MLAMSGSIVFVSCMDLPLIATLLLLALAAGFAGGLLYGRRHEQTLRDRLTGAETRAAAEQAHHAERLAELKDLRRQFETTFQALSSEALKSNNAAFLELAQSSFQPVRLSLEKIDTGLQDLERKRLSAYTGLQEQVRGLLDAQNHLQKETSTLAQALRHPGARGRWGELQLQRTVELAGMTEQVDFVQQTGSETERGRQRPDMIVRLPGGRSIVIDAKAPLDAYLASLETTDPAARDTLLDRHARQIREHVRALAQKQYWRQFDPGPEFVVLFLPGEVFFSAALQRDPGLIEAGAADHVLIATPTTLIAMLRAVAHGWREEAVAAEARQIGELGHELYERICTQNEHFSQLGKALERAVDAYNKSARSLESRVLVSARRFQDLASARSPRELPTPAPVEASPRPPSLEAGNDTGEAAATTDET
jgi:DNA recombination protein RmuC